jgi:hypothetical protein
MAGAIRSTLLGSRFVQNQLTIKSGFAARTRATASRVLMSGTERLTPTNRGMDDLVPIGVKQKRREWEPEERDPQLVRQVTGPFSTPVTGSSPS